MGQEQKESWFNRFKTYRTEDVRNDLCKQKFSLVNLQPSADGPQTLKPRLAMNDIRKHQPSTLVCLSISDVRKYRPFLRGARLFRPTTNLVVDKAIMSAVDNAMMHFQGSLLVNKDLMSKRIADGKKRTHKIRAQVRFDDYSYNPNLGK